MTIYDIAKLAGVSKSTVSRVINNDSAVSDSVRKHVESVIEEQNFIPNSQARMMTKKSVKKILVLMTRLDSYAETRTFRGIIENAAGESDFILHETNFCIDKTKCIIENNKYIDGIIIFAIGNESYEFLDKINIPVVFIGQKIKAYKHIVYNDYNAMISLLEELELCKSDTILYVGLNDNDPTTGLIRKNAFVEYMSKHNLNNNIVLTDFIALNTYNNIREIEISKYTHIVCATDRIALGVYKHCLKANIDPVITGVGDNKSLNFIIDKFYSINLSYKRSGMDAYKILFSPKHDNVTEDYKIVKSFS